MFKTIKPVFAAGILCLAFASCKKDVAENPGAETTGAAKAESASTASYYNTGDATYVDSTNAGSATVTKSAIKISGDTTIDGKKFTMASSGNSATRKFYNTTDGVTTLVSYNGDDKITTTLLKANEPVGTVWKDVFTNKGVPVTYEWEMIAKGISKTVQGVTYNNVIQVHLKGYAEKEGKGKIALANSDYYYAPNVGLIETISYNTTTGKAELHRLLQQPLTP